MAATSPPLVVKGQGEIMISEKRSLSQQKYGHEMWKQKTSYQTQNWQERVCIWDGSSVVSLELSRKTVAKQTGLLIYTNILPVLDTSWVTKGGGELPWPPLWHSHMLPWQEFPLNADHEGQPARHHLRASLLNCPLGIPMAAAAQKPPVHPTFTTTEGKFPWRFGLGKVPLIG